VLQQAVELLDPSASPDLVGIAEIRNPVGASEGDGDSVSVLQDYCLSIIEGLAENCYPREMFAAFVEVNDRFRPSLYI